MKELRLKDFIDVDLKVFSNLDNVRSIPSIIDGLKDSQRKAVHGLIKHGNDKIKVAQLGSYACLITEYAHGEGSMCSTIVGLAQNFPGSNNVNLFEPIGQFGSILSGDSASPRYIYTKPSKNLRTYLKSEDDKILNFKQSEDGVLEPEHYFPTMPMWVVNGAIGVGTGHSSKILSRSPANVAKAIKAIVGSIVKKDSVYPDISALMVPHFEGWKGTVTKGDSDTQWVMTGCLEKVNTTTIKITELPVMYGVDKYKEILINLMDKGVVKDYDNNSNEESFEFIVSVPREVGRQTEKQLIDLFKLSTKFGENVTLWNTKGKLKRYNNVDEALFEFVNFRLTKYQVRKDSQIAEIEKDIVWAEAKRDFIHWWVNAKDPHLLPNQELVDQLKLIVKAEFIDSLLALQIRSLTKSKIEELTLSIDKLKSEKVEIEKQELSTMYLQNLKGL